MKMKNTDVIISSKFQENMQAMNIYAQLSKSNETCFRGNIKKVDKDLYILRDEKGRDICGILDQRSFMEALLETDVSHLWISNNKKRGTSN